MDGGSLTPLAMKDLLEAGVHFGHQTKRWNPKMKPFIFGERCGIYILDLGKTVKHYREAEDFVRQLAAEGKTILFVGTKRQAQDVVAEEAARCGMFYVNERWLGGLLTNFTTIQRSIARLRDLEAMATDGRYEFDAEEGNREGRKGEAQAAEEPRRHPPHGPAARRALRRRHAQGTDRRRRSAQAEDSRSSASSTPTAIPTRSTSSFPATTTRCARSSCSSSRIADAVIDGRGERESAMAEQAQARRRSGGRRRSAPHRAPGGPPQAAAPGRDASADRRSRLQALPSAPAAVTRAGAMLVRAVVEAVAGPPSPAPRSGPSSPDERF